MSETTGIDILLAQYIKLRDAKEALAKKQKEEMGRITGTMDKIEQRISTRLDEAGTDSMRVKGLGTCFFETLSTVKVEDREAYLKFVLDHGMHQFLPSSANKSAVEEFLAEHAELPPGVSITRIRKVKIRRG